MRNGVALLLLALLAAAAAAADDVIHSAQDNDDVIDDWVELESPPSPLPAVAPGDSANNALKSQQQPDAETKKQLQTEQLEKLFAEGSSPFDRGGYMEIAFALALILYAIFWYFGRNENLTLAQIYGQSVHSAFSERFNLIGEDAVLEESCGVKGGLIQEGNAAFRLRASGGWKSCVSAQATFAFKRRHDLVSTMAFEAMNPVQDEVELDFLLPEGAADAFVFAVVPARKAVPTVQETPDLQKFFSGKVLASSSAAASAQRWGLPDALGLTVLAEVDEVPKRLFGRDGGEFLSSLKACAPGVIKLIHFSDQSIASDEFPLSLRAVLALPARGSMSATDYDVLVQEQFARPLKMILKLVDVLASFKLSPAARQRSIDSRATEAKATARERREQLEEQAQERKRLKLKEERERLSGEERARFDEKVARKNQKRQQRKMAGKMRVAAKF